MRGVDEQRSCAVVGPHELIIQKNFSDRPYCVLLAEERRGVTVHFLSFWGTFPTRYVSFVS